MLLHLNLDLEKDQDQIICIHKTFKHRDREKFHGLNNLKLDFKPTKVLSGLN
jgi:hypothetical protein